MTNIRFSKFCPLFMDVLTKIPKEWMKRNIITKYELQHDLEQIKTKNTKNN
jgi:hypothetical protein